VDLYIFLITWERHLAKTREKLCLPTGLETRLYGTDASCYLYEFGNLSQNGVNIYTDLGHDNWVPTENYPWTIDDWLFFMNACVYEFSIYRDYIKIYEILNEINLWGFWQAEKELYYELLNRTAYLLYQIKQDNPNANFEVSTCGFAGTALDTIQELFEFGAMKYVDILAFHPYSRDYDSLDEKIDQVHTIASRYNFTGKYIITEIGAFSDEKLDQIDAMRHQANEIVKVYALGLINTKMKFITYYNAEGFSIDGKLAGNTYNLLFNLISRKWYCPDGAIIRGPIGKDQIETHLFVDNVTNDAVLILWQLQAPVLRIRVKIPQKIIDHVWIHDIYSNSTHQVLNHESNDRNESTFETFFNIKIGTEPLIYAFKFASSPTRIFLDIEWDTYQILVYLIFPAALVIIILTFISNKIKTRKKSMSLFHL